MVPGVGSVTYDVCYSRSATLRWVLGYSDLIRSPQDRIDFERAEQIAEEYNALLAKGLVERGKSRCPEGTDWDRGFDALYKKARAEGIGELDFALDGKPDQPTVRLGPSATDRRSVTTALCRTANELRLSPTLSVRFTAPSEEISCAAAGER